MSIPILGLLLAAAGPLPAPLPAAHPAAVRRDAVRRDAVRRDAGADLQALLAEYSEQQRAFYERLQALDDPAEAERLMREENPLPAFIERFRELAFESAGTETGVTAWIWVGNLALDNLRLDEARESLEVLLGDHIDSPQLASVAQALRYNAARFGDGTGADALGRILAGSPHANVRASAQFSLASLLMESKVEAERARGRALFEEMPAKYADVEGGWGERAQGMLFELDHLQVGMIAPDFEAVDADGVKWKLSDYRGKVVIVDFWGFW